MPSRINELTIGELAESVYTLIRGFIESGNINSSSDVPSVPEEYEELTLDLCIRKNNYGQWQIINLKTHIVQTYDENIENYKM